jgi:hypothetical protein
MRHDIQVQPPAEKSDTLVARMLTRVVRRMWLQHALAAMSALAVCGAAGMSIGRPALGSAFGAAAGVVMLWAVRRKRSTAAAARRLEAIVPGCSNLMITAEELLRHPDRAAAWVRARVFADAAERTRSARVNDVVPLARSVIVLVTCAALAAALSTRAGRSASAALRTAITSVPNAGTVGASTPLRILVTVTPPSYTGKPAREEMNPERIEAIEGSALRIAVSGAETSWRIRSASGVFQTHQVSGATIVDTTASESGYFAIESFGDSGAAPDRRLIPFVVVPDRVPSVRIDAPGRDLVLPNANRNVSISALASDDLGLAALEIRYTKVSGSGEQFEFEEGVLPATVARDSDRAWRANGQLRIPSLKLEPGDALVYRAVARDRRPGDAGVASSDSFFIEISGPGQVALEGFEMPPDQERYALSQQMIVLKIQRLRARQRVMATTALAEAAASIAAEQRAVRANLIFIMGGHVEDEEVEAEQSNEIQEGRLQNSARREINAAVGHMSRAEQALVAVNTAPALAAARAAVEALQRAFGRSRYILRTIPVGSRIDPSRRLSGELSAAADWRRDPDAPSLDRDTLETRTLLSRLMETAAAISAGQVIESSVFSSLAEQALAIEPDASEWQEVARRLQQIHRGSPESTSSQLSAAMSSVIARARQGARMPSNRATQSPAGLCGAWAREFRRGRQP